MKNILFDLDGTLTDPKEGIINSLSFALQKMGKSVPQNLDWCIGPPLQESLSKILGTQNDEIIKQALELYREKFKTTGMFENKVYFGIDGLLKKLKGQSHQLYVATSKPHIFAKNILKHFKIDHYFNEIYGPELNGLNSDKADLINYILVKENLSLPETIMVGDREHDIIGAKKNNILSIGVLWGYGTIEELSNVRPNWIAKNIDDLFIYLNT